MAASLLRNGELLQGAADVLGQLADEEDEWATEALAGGPGAGERENEP